MSKERQEQVRLILTLIGGATLLYVALRFVGWEPFSSSLTPESKPVSEPLSQNGRGGRGFSPADSGIGTVDSYGGEGQPLETVVPPPIEGEKREAEPGADGLGSTGIHFEISGNERFTDEEIISSLHLPEVSQVSLLEEVVKRQVVDFYRSKGYVEARVSKYEATRGMGIEVSLEVSEGKEYFVGTFELEGVTFFSPGEVRALYVSPGEPADTSRVWSSDKMLREEYQKNGYLDAQVNSERSRVSGDSQVNFKVTVVEGPRYQVGETAVPATYRARFPFHQGDYFNQSRWDEFISSQGLSYEQAIVDKYPEDGKVRITLYE